MAKPRIFSGVQPSGNLHIGNYLGAITQFVALQEKYDCIFCVVDYHAITVKQDPEILRKKIIEIARLFIASGIDPDRSVIFQQSDVSAHTELSWILNCVARMSDMRKMTQFKDKSGGEEENVSVGLFDYPALMAADILLYDTDTVPVGEDQSQHVELARTLARRFNNDYAPVFKVPEPMIRREGARIMGLDDPAKKMSKSAKSEYNRIGLLDDPKAAAKKILRAETDSGREIVYDPENKPGISNLLTIYSLLAERSIESLAGEYRDKGYGGLKKDLGGIVGRFLMKFQSRYNKISDKQVGRIMDEGADRVRPLAEKKLGEAKEALGIK